MPTHPPAAEGLVWGSRLQDINTLSARFPQCTLATDTGPSAFLESGCETGLSFVVSTSGGAGLVSAD